jgi:hypothetical protein
LGLMIGMPMLGHAAAEHGSHTHSFDLPSGWQFDVGSSTGQTTEFVKAYVRSGGAFIDPSMINIRVTSASVTGNSFAIPVQSPTALVDEYAPFISEKDAEIVRRLAGSMSSGQPVPSRFDIYETY